METLIRNILNQVKLQKIYARETAQVISIPKHRTLKGYRNTAWQPPAQLKFVFSYF